MKLCSRAIYESLRKIPTGKTIAIWVRCFHIISLDYSGDLYSTPGAPKKAVLQNEEYEQAKIQKEKMTKNEEDLVDDIDKEIETSIVNITRKDVNK